MSRPLRVEYEGAVYHVTSRGNTGQNIYTHDRDRQKFLTLLAREIEQQRWLCHSYCLMGSHYHLLLETPEPNLSRGMKRLNANYSQWFNYHYHRHGHLLQGRYKAILVEKESYLLELTRYVVLNPVRARMVEEAKRWPWSSYRATAGIGTPPRWLCTKWILSHFGMNTKRARRGYRQFVQDGLQVSSPWKDVRGRIFLGSEAFLRVIGARIEETEDTVEQIPHDMMVPHRPTAKAIIERLAHSLRVAPEELFNRRKEREAFQLVVYLLRRVANLPLGEVADMAGVSRSRISQIQKRFDSAPDSLTLPPETRALLYYYKLKL